MKKYLTIASTGLICFYTSCTSTGGGNTQGQKNIDGVHAIHRMIESGDVSKADQYIATDAIDHTGEQGEVKGIDGIKAELQKIHNDYKDLKMDEKQDAANNDYVFSLTQFIGTSTTNTMGAGPGTHFDMPFIDVVKFNSEGKATDHWEYMTMADMMKMMGGEKMEKMGGKMDTSMNKMKMDTTKH